MLRSALLVGSLTSVAFGAVANFCVEEPYREMQGFRDFEPAMDRCAAHYPVETITKVLPNACLTTTQTVILGTSTVHATRTQACPTVHLEMRDEDVLVARDDSNLEARWEKKAIYGGAKYGGAIYGGPQHGGAKHGGAKHGGAKHHHGPEGYHHGPEGYHHGPGGYHHKPEHHHGPGGYHHGPGGYHHKPEHHHGPGEYHHGPGGYHHGPGGYHDGPGGYHHGPGGYHHGPGGYHGPTKYPHSHEPPHYHYARATPAPMVKRDIIATKAEAWSSYYAGLVDCGYNCIQTACSCVASPRVEIQTPAPTCTSTLTKETIVHETKTIDVAPEQC